MAEAVAFISESLDPLAFTFHSRLADFSSQEIRLDLGCGLMLMLILSEMLCNGWLPILVTPWRYRRRNYGGRFSFLVLLRILLPEMGWTPSHSTL
jgi:hypothetical protein